MQNVTQQYKNIVAGEHWFERRVRLYMPTQTIFGEEDLISLSITQSLFSENRPMVGCACSAEATVEMYKPDATIPRMAKFAIDIRAVNDTQESPWYSQGVFYIDEREYTKMGGDSIIKFHGYDAMAKAEATYPSTNHIWPYSAAGVVNEIAQSLGIVIDNRTWSVMPSVSAGGGYRISLPATYSCREVLKNIAAMYAGNWYITPDGYLRLVGLNTLPADTNYLITEGGNAITFGGVRIIV